MKRTALLFSGQGAQHVGMGRDLVDHHPEALALYARADELLKNDFSKVCFDGPEATLTDTSYCQPALFVHGLALLAILQKELPHFTFEATAGLSLGEFTAHTAAGHLTFEDGLRLVAARGRLMQEACLATEGGMLTLIGATEAQAAELASASGLQIANINCPGQIVLSGEKALIPAAIDKGKALGLKRVIPLNVAGAYHSRLMQSAQDGLAPVLQATPFTPTAIVTPANINATFPTAADEIRATLLSQVTGTVRWQACVEALIARGIERFIELGPGKILAGMVKRIHPSIPCLSIGNHADLQGALHELTS
jgi:[acyl-carrier-protein] S-malonyltransferase